MSLLFCAAVQEEPWGWSSLIFLSASSYSARIQGPRRFSGAIMNSLRLSQSSIRKSSSFGIPLFSAKADSLWVNTLFQLRFFKLGQFTRFLVTLFVSLPYCASKGSKFTLLLGTNHKALSALSMSGLNCCSPSCTGFSMSKNSARALASRMYVPYSSKHF